MKSYNHTKAMEIDGVMYVYAKPVLKNSIDWNTWRERSSFFHELSSESRISFKGALVNVAERSGEEIGENWEEITLHDINIRFLDGLYIVSLGSLFKVEIATIDQAVGLDLIAPFIR